MKELEYDKIGKRIRAFRKLKNFSQEELAEIIEISPTHMSHIETGSTKLSLTVLVAIADALEVHTDELLYESPDLSDQSKAKLVALLDNCSPKEIMFLNQLVFSAKSGLSQYIK